MTLYLYNVYAALLLLTKDIVPVTFSYMYILFSTVYCHFIYIFNVYAALLLLTYNDIVPVTFSLFLNELGHWVYTVHTVEG